MNDRKFDPNKSDRLDSAERKRQLPPEAVLKELPIKKSDKVLDLGAGTGYFTFPIAQLTDETVYALDIEPKMLDILATRTEEHKAKNVKILKGDIQQIPLPSQEVDHILASLVLHEVELIKTLKEIQRVLKPNGTCLCLEWERKQSNEGPPLHHRVKSTDMEQSMESVGLIPVQISSPTEDHYLILAKKR
ncbi:SAM-dependent methyltransferase [Kroppenstedtia guangzhouensis]|jgi:ubiquinone/menaquinone biosynthesis C-methylase UbiE|uniref:SAM-dependent methyltransferase n=1 Tax=Kroppenstedtia guangzhouensis TaxID=1274356 RepID=A0ABQ1H4Q4_9BACL|nr:class I SAM-dependent methyltransferase [Kroppenstedtia guangzhouensis]GGA57701.1 SAM-dependent methyltransferase [Kroppenstedtia guangzhouensis]